MIVLENELLRIGVLASKGADLVELRYKPRDLDLLWRAPQALLPGEYVPSVARPEGAFLDYYPGGWQEIFPSAGPATTIEGAPLGQHGETALLPWDVRVAEDTPARTALEFTVETQRTPFRLVRRMSLESESPVLRFEEEVVNLGRIDLPFGWGHHPVFGPPFLEAGCTIEMPSCAIEQAGPGGDSPHRFAAGSRGRYPYLSGQSGDPLRMDMVPEPEAGTEDVLVCGELADAWCAVRNPRLQLAVGLVWDARVFPYLWLWQSYGGNRGYPFYGRAYNLGVEPFNCMPGRLADQAAAATLKAGESLATALECSVRPASHPVESVTWGGAFRTRS